ncbi:MAG: DNA mismatch repair protein MutL [Bradymonadia bacterium]|jgi:DNA mismatch repair protein MutL
MTSAAHPNTQPRIHRMPEDLANQIAAGEVVERPASAVKELVENALDAGATRVRIELERGGLSLLRVVDDGHGMSADDARLCIERHATSKLTSRDQLFRIATFGFRGEALPSIASVSRFSLTTKPRGVLGGTRVEVNGGVVQRVGDAGCPPGTEIVVEDLFFNTPARLKFLKKEATELRQVTETVQRLALAHPETHFTVAHNGRVYLDLPSVTAIEERLVGILGRDDASMVFPLEPAEQDGVTASGFFSQPTLTRRTSNALWTFVNGRFVRDRTIQSAVRVGYEGMLDRGRYPVVLLYLDVPFEMVDVNVHPMKTEVRFHRADAVFRAVRRAVAQSLATAPWVPAGQAAPSGAWVGRRAEQSDGPSVEQAELPVRTYTLHSRGGAPSHSVSVGPWTSGTSQWSGAGTDDAEVAESGQGSDTQLGAGYFERLHYIGNYRSTYLLNADRGGLVVVDQHAAHERITFERLRLSWRDRRTQTQPMLVPALLSLDASRTLTLSDNLEFFSTLGFEIEPFGETDFALKAAPAVLGQRPLQAMLIDALDDLAEHGQSTRLEDAVDAILLRMACHGSIRAGDTLTKDEVYELYRELDRVDFGANCPHGRPVYFNMTLEELETRFERR